ncbi:hypothetical protein MEN41_00680 [Dolichospermum sp. ST_con]|nr:hypothetical protein [Dolichospermum sp. ST_con]MDD1418373.1 hypothetical protein [Dolichospermum sp. ST_sed1]MDD1426257.1 hypothetical protein [Dolichospermum sp. ST_sed9]MDD1431439.1 hypothetical protein [Dolichospermum sp. ST_sed6]MDD1438359.1 hypothetical protein [Dolichospermum sp. ST_sed10]MDD1442125.1 hypothetical protein [Dolichospermum sp. ST_sed3]MDD1445636.1 hypothetical protein [Dolichospermum sp. ST_sed8]MDD1456317.1 hypothetical protein [Dolichospermum sp. ST_sed7]MDD146199
MLSKNEITSLGASLRAIAPKLLKQSLQEGAIRIWFQGGEPYFDVFFELNNHEVTWFQFTLRGKSLSWSSNKPLFKTGITNELNIDDVSFYAASKTVKNDHESDREFIDLVKLILQTRPEEEIFVKALALF